MPERFVDTPLRISTCGGVLIAFGLMQGALSLITFALLADKRHWFAFALLLLMAAVGIVSVFAGFALYALRTWARYFGISVGVYLLAIAGLILLLTLGPLASTRSDTGDDGYVIALAPIAVLAGLWLISQLTPPNTARLFQEANSIDNESSF